MSEPKKHHLVPEVYLSEFAAGNLLQVYDLKWKKKGKPRTPAQVAYEIDAFTLRNNETMTFHQIEDKNVIEKESFKRVENKYPKILSKIKGTIGNITYLNDNEATDFLAFLLSIKRRSHDFRKGFLDKESIKKHAQERIKKMMPAIKEAADLVGEGKDIELSLERQIENTLNNDDKLYDGYLLQLKDDKIVNDLINRLKTLRWVIASAPINRHFITSDNPGFSINNLDEVSRFGGFGEAFTFIFPISPLHAFIIGDKYSDNNLSDKKTLHIKNFNADSINSINKITLATAKKRFLQIRMIQFK